MSFKLRHYIAYGGTGEAGTGDFHDNASLGKIAWLVDLLAVFTVVLDWRTRRRETQPFAVLKRTF